MLGQQGLPLPVDRIYIVGIARQYLVKHIVGAFVTLIIEELLPLLHRLSKCNIAETCNACYQ